MVLIVLRRLVGLNFSDHSLIFTVSVKGPVKEVYDGQYGPTSMDTLWFIDFNDKVCLRIPKSGRLNMSDVMKIIEKFEDQYEVSLEIKNPYRMSKGWSKVDYTLTQKNK